MIAPGLLLAGDPSTGVSAVDAAVVWAAAAAGLTGVLAGVWRLVRAVRRVLHRVEEIVDDWQGVPGRAGVPARPGVMQRLDGLERAVVAIADEMRPNSGSSLRDALDRVDRRTASLTGDEQAPDPNGPGPGPSGPREHS